MNNCRMLEAVVCLVTLEQVLPAQTSPELLWHSWSNVATLQTGQKISLETVRPKQKLKGRFLSSNDAAITIQTAGGQQTIAKPNVHRVTRTRNIKTALAIGAASGVAAYAIVAPRSDFTASGHFVFGAAFAGIGTLVGWAIGSVGGSKLIYQSGSR
jgi:hypothetical protein